MTQVIKADYQALLWPSNLHRGAFRDSFVCARLWCNVQTTDSTCAAGRMCERETAWYFSISFSLAILHCHNFFFYATVSFTNIALTQLKHLISHFTFGEQQIERTKADYFVCLLRFFFLLVYFFCFLTYLLHISFNFKDRSKGRSLYNHFYFST